MIRSVFLIFCVQGLFTRSEQILPFINEEGRETLKELEGKFYEDSDEDSDEDSNEDSDEDSNLDSNEDSKEGSDEDYE